MKTHAEHETTVAIGRVQGFLLCLDCRAIIEALPLCGKPTKRGGSCRWAVQIGADNAEHPHTPQKPAQEPTKQVIKKAKTETVGLSPVEVQWLASLVTQHGHISEGSLVLTDIKRGQAKLLVERYGGYGTGEKHTDWQWRCEGPQAARIIAALQQV